MGRPSTLASVDGGVWKTADAGVTWNPVFDGQPIASIGALEVAPSNPNVIYAGTGESDIRSALELGRRRLQVQRRRTRPGRNVGLHDSRQISRIVIDPQQSRCRVRRRAGSCLRPESRARSLQVDRRRRDLDARSRQRTERSASPILRLRQRIRTFCSRARGMRIVLRGAPTRRCKVRAADSIARPTAARPGRN